MAPETIQELWALAKKVEIGVAVELESHTDMSVFMNQFYEVRKAMGDPELDKITLARPGPKPNEIWFVKQSVELT